MLNLQCCLKLTMTHLKNYDATVKQQSAYIYYSKCFVMHYFSQKNVFNFCSYLTPNNSEQIASPSFIAQTKLTQLNFLCFLLYEAPDVKVSHERSFIETQLFLEELYWSLIKCLSSRVGTAL